MMAGGKPRNVVPADERPRPRNLLLDGRKVRQRDLAEMAGISEAMMSRRLWHYGMTPEEAVAAPKRNTGRHPG